MTLFFCYDSIKNWFKMGYQERIWYTVPIDYFLSKSFWRLNANDLTQMLSPPSNFNVKIESGICMGDKTSVFVLTTASASRNAAIGSDRGINIFAETFPMKESNK